LENPFLAYETGLFQGCVFSVILFLIVFKLLLDFVMDLQQHGCSIKEASIRAFHLAYADDLTFLTKNTKGNQLALDRTHVFLEWTNCMKAKPSKCRSLACKAFTNSSNNVQPFTGHQYSSFDPNLSISGQRIQFIKDVPFKFLGRLENHDLSEEKQSHAVAKRFYEHLDLVDRQFLTGAMKVWLYQHYILAYLTWPLLVYDFPLSFAKELQKEANKRIKQWLKINKKANVSILYRSRKNKGLQLCSVSKCLKRSQGTKAHIIKHSSDPNMLRLHTHQLQTAQQNQRDWKPVLPWKQQKLK